MDTLLIADGDPLARQDFIDLFSPEGFHIIASESVVDLLREIRGRSTRVLLLGNEINGLPSVDLIPLLRKCNGLLRIILIAENSPTCVSQRFGNENFLFYGPRPQDIIGRSRLLQEVRCAFVGGPLDKGMNDVQ